MIVLGHIADGAIGEFADAIAVRIVSGDHQIVFTDILDVGRRQLFAGFAAGPTLTLEIIAGLFLSGFRLALALMFPVFVHAFEPERHPAAA